MAEGRLAALKARAEGLFMRFLIWRERHVKEKTFVIFLSLVVGVLGGFAALILKSLIHLISGLLTSHLSVTDSCPL